MCSGHFLGTGSIFVVGNGRCEGRLKRKTAEKLYGRGCSWNLLLTPLLLDTPTTPGVVQKSSRRISRFEIIKHGIKRRNMSSATFARNASIPPFVVETVEFKCDRQPSRRCRRRPNGWLVSSLLVCPIYGRRLDYTPFLSIKQSPRKHNCMRRRRVVAVNNAFTVGELGEKTELRETRRSAMVWEVGGWGPLSHRVDVYGSRTIK